MAKIALFRNATDTLTYAAGDVIFEQGAPGDAAYVVVDGVVEIVRDGIVIETCRDGSVLGELALIDDGPRHAAAIACEQTRLAVLDQARFVQLVQEHPTFALQVMRIMADRLRKVTQSPDD